MADLVMGAMGTLIPKLHELLKEEYNLQTHVKERIRSFSQELEHAQAALRKVAQIPWDQLDEQLQLWSGEVREASYDMEDVLDTFLVRVQGPADSAEQENSLLKPLKKITNLLKTSKARRKISSDVKDIMTHLQEVAERCSRYKVEDIVARTATAPTIDPRLHAMYNKVKNLVGIDKSSGELISMLRGDARFSLPSAQAPRVVSSALPLSRLQSPQQDDVSDTKVRIVSIVGVGGLGKTTLAKVVYDKLKGSFDCGAFVPAGRSPDLKKIFKDILMDLDKKQYLQFSTLVLDERQLIDELRSFLHENKRYLIIIDDIWEVESWETIRLAIDDENYSGGRIIITTRKLEVATKADEVYKLQPLSYDSSRELFVTRISGQEGKYIHNQLDEIADKFIRKSGGVPLAIITMASLLAGKPRDKWSELYNTIDFASKDNKEAENTMRILSFSYYDLPSHLRTCLLYLSAFPEDSFIDKGSLIWMWVAEGFVHKKDGMRLFEIGEGYFNDLINRSMIQAQEDYYDRTIIIGCRVHDMVLDFIRFMSQEEISFTVLDNDQGTLLQQSNIVRRLANHNRTIGHTHQASHIEMPKLRSFIALRCVIETWASLSSFTILRVLAIENCNPGKDWPFHADGLRYLPHLRFLSLRGTWIDRIPEDIGSLRFLETLDLLGSDISELPSSGSLPKQLACLRINFSPREEFFVGGMTSLEELTIDVSSAVQWPVEGLGSLRELRVLNILNISWELGDERDMGESLGHLQKLQSLTIGASYLHSLARVWRGTDFVLPHHLHHLAVTSVCFSSLPSCIHPWCHPNLSHLDLRLKHLYEKDLKTLGSLPDLHYLSLDLGLSGATIHNISDSDACYFPELRCFKLTNAMFSFDTKIDHNMPSLFIPQSFHVWNGYDDDTSMPSAFDNESSQSVSDDELEGARSMSSAFDNESWQSVTDDELEGARTFVSDDELERAWPSVSDDELERAWPSFCDDEPMSSVGFLFPKMSSVSDDESKTNDEMQSHMPSASHDVELHRQLESSILQQGLHPLPCNRASSPGNDSGEDPATTPSIVWHFNVDDENNGSIICSKGTAAAAPRFMPSLQALHFKVNYLYGIPDWVYNLGWEHLSSLREINADLYCPGECKDILETKLRRAAKVHPNHPTLHIKK